jgi:hypothetical protein
VFDAVTVGAFVFDFINSSFWLLAYVFIKPTLSVATFDGWPFGL